MPPGIYPRPSLRERLFSRLVIDQETGCVLWTGYRNRDGYGDISVDNTHYMVHRVVWELLEGPIADGLVLDHVKARGCLNRHCASITHLEPVTQRENLLRAQSFNAAKTHCRNGHEFTEANTYLWRGERRCRRCNRDYQARKKSEAQAVDRG
jgi:hypothetical protein